MKKPKLLNISVLINRDTINLNSSYSDQIKEKVLNQKTFRFVPLISIVYTLILMIRSHWSLIFKDMTQKKQ